jgi:hypothetical protein
VSPPGARGTGGNRLLPAGRPGPMSLPARSLIRHHEGYRGRFGLMRPRLEPTMQLQERTRLARGWSQPPMNVRNYVDKGLP